MHLVTIKNKLEYKKNYKKKFFKVVLEMGLYFYFESNMGIGVSKPVIY